MSSTELYNYQFNGNESEHPELLSDKRVSRLFSSTRGSGSSCQISRKRKQLELTISHRNYRKLEERPRLTHSLWLAPTLGSQKRRPQHRPFTDHKKGNLQQCKTYRIVSHPSKVVLKISLAFVQREAQRNILSIRTSCVKKTPASTKHLQCLHQFQEGFWRGMACSFRCSHNIASVQPYPCHATIVCEDQQRGASQ